MVGTALIKLTDMNVNARRNSLDSTAKVCTFLLYEKFHSGYVVITPVILIQVPISGIVKLSALSKSFTFHSTFNFLITLLIKMTKFGKLSLNSQNLIQFYDYQKDVDAQFVTTVYNCFDVLLSLVSPPKVVPDIEINFMADSCKKFKVVVFLQYV